MKTLSECQLFMSYAGLGTKKSVNIGGKHLPRAIIQILVVLVFISLLCIQVTNSINNFAIGPQAILFPVHSVVLVSIKLITFVILVVKIDEIAELFEYLQMVVNRRNIEKKTFFFDFHVL